jgi:ribosomal protein S27AE
MEEKSQDSAEETPKWKVQFCVHCGKGTRHKYLHRSWVCGECRKDEWL